MDDFLEEEIQTLSMTLYFLKLQKQVGTREKTTEIKTEL